MFKKINLPVINLSLHILQGSRIIFDHFGKRLPEFENFTEYYVNPGLLKDLTFKIKPDNMNITRISHPGVKPHKDAWQVGLNFYLSGGNDCTHYWKLKHSNDRNSSTLPRGFQKSELDLVDSFIAKPNEWYLLDTKQIHSVEMPNTIEPRFMLRFIWRNNSFDEILKSLEN